MSPGPKPVTIGGRIFVISAHAASRYRQRECPKLSLSHAAGRLHGELKRYAVIDLCLPRWAMEQGLAGRLCDEYVSLEDRLLFPVTNGVLQTCISNGRGVGAQIRIVR